MRYVDYYEQSFFEGNDALDINFKNDMQNYNIDDISILKTPDEDPNQSLFDDVLQQVFLKNANKKKKNQLNNSGIANNNLSTLASNLRQNKTSNLNTLNKSTDSGMIKERTQSQSRNILPKSHIS